MKHVPYQINRTNTFIQAGKLLRSYIHFQILFETLRINQPLSLTFKRSLCQFHDALTEYISKVYLCNLHSYVVTQITRGIQIYEKNKER